MYNFIFNEFLLKFLILESAKDPELALPSFCFVVLKHTSHGHTWRSWFYSEIYMNRTPLNSMGLGTSSTEFANRLGSLEILGLICLFSLIGIKKISHWRAVVVSLCLTIFFPLFVNSGDKICSSYEESSGPPHSLHGKGKRGNEIWHYRRRGKLISHPKTPKFL